jgi:DNA-binding transcriptional LysR family regulator
VKTGVDATVVNIRGSIVAVPRRAMTNFETLRAFVDIVEHGSLSAAGRATGIAKATLSRQLGELERELGTALVHRTTRAQSITAAGRALYERMAPLVAEADAAVLDTQSAAKEPAGLIRIAAALGFGQSVLLPLVAQFMVKYPKVRCELVLSDDVARLVDSGFDLAIRMGRLEESELSSRRIARIERILVASAEYLATHGTPRKVSDLGDHAALITDPKHATWTFEGKRGPSEVRLRWRIATGGMPALVEAARLHLGIASLPRYMVEPHLRSRELVRVDVGAAFPWSYATALYPGKMVSTGVRRFLNYVIEALSRDPVFGDRAGDRDRAG